MLEPSRDAQAAVAIENARLYESSTRWLRRLETLNEIGSALASEVELEPLLGLVARRMQELVEARIVLIALPDAQGTLRVTAAAGGDDLVGIELELSSTKVGRVLERGLGEERLAPETETVLYRIVQESLTNVVKHASAGHVSITLVRKGTSAVVVVEDDGGGFDPDRIRAGALGIAGMRERVALLGGKLTLESAPGAGTTLVAEVPASARGAEGAP